MTTALIIIGYILMSLLTTWFNYEMLKALSESKKRETTFRTLALGNKWELAYNEGPGYTVALVFNGVGLWPLITPGLWIVEYCRKVDWSKKPILRNPMRYLIKELLAPKDNV